MHSSPGALTHLHYEPEQTLQAFKHNIPFVKKMADIAANLNTNYQSAFPGIAEQYEVGEWVDAKDTIEQWLEAQVMQLNNGKAYIHYNGWESRWDEWIDIHSGRLAPFRTYTIQYPSMHFQEPIPNIKAESVNEIPLNIEEAIKNFSKILTQDDLHKSVGSILYRYSELINNDEKEGKHKNRIIEDLDYEEEKQYGKTVIHKKPFDQTKIMSAQLSSLFDRYGRMMIDASPLMAHYGKPEIVVNNQIKREKLLEETGDICINVQLLI